MTVEPTRAQLEEELRTLERLAGVRPVSLKRIMAEREVLRWVLGHVPAPPSARYFELPLALKEVHRTALKEGKGDA